MLTLAITAAIPLAQYDPTVRIEPVQSMVTVDESFTVSVMIDDASDLGAFQFDLRYTAAIVRVNGVTLGAFLGSTGRSVAPIGPKIDNQAGKVTFGTFSFGDLQGPNGTGELAIISFTAQGQGGSPLDLRSVLVLDTSGHSQVASIEDGSVVVSGPTMPTPTATPILVGGVVVPVNMLELLAPWLGPVAVALLAVALLFCFSVVRGDRWRAT
jgi:hypothetical protein